MIQAKKILIVEDESVLLDVLCKHFKKEGYQVALAPDGIEGLKQVELFKPDLVLLDIIMPRMNGIAMLKKLKENTETKDIPVIILTNLETANNVTEAAEAGSTDYLVKVNYSLEDLSKKIKGIFEKNS